tara:strand:- start:931 stop:2082 length:1152 start_codon:yes stop_codon:yes gene_type:complete
MRSPIQRALIVAAALLVLSPTLADEAYPSSVVGTEFDYITDTDPDTFLSLTFKGRGLEEMPDKSGDAPLRQEAFRFLASFSDGTQVKINLDADFKTEAAAKAEALRYTPRLGKLPTSLRRGLERLVVHEGNPDTTAFSDRGLIVVYSANATERIATHDLEETIFHESVHAAWDGLHAKSKAWLAAQTSDGKFITRYARKNPQGEDLAESALFAFTLIHHPERIPAADAERIRAAIPARIAFVKSLLPPGKPLTFKVKADYRARVAEAYRAAERSAERAQEGSKERAQAKPGAREGKGRKCSGQSGKCALETLDLKTAVGISDILSNALASLGQDEAAVNAFLEGATSKQPSAAALIKAAASRFGLEESALKKAVRANLHCNCK